MGRGSFITNMAILNPNVNYIGLEIDKSQTATAINKIGGRVIPNLRIICADAKDIINFFGKK